MENKKNKAKYLFLVFGIIIFTIYFLPVFGPIVNFGNIFGMAVGLLLILVFAFYNKLRESVKKISKSQIGKCFIALFLVVVIAFVSLFAVTLISVIASSKYTANDENTVIVLGCRVFGTKPSRELQKRCDVAFDYLEKHPDSVAILTGAKGDDEEISEAQCQYNILVEKGIDKDRLFIEDKSTSTEGNIKNAKEIIDENGLSMDVAIATSAYNQKRASMIARKYQLTASSIPSVSGFYSIPTYFTREVFAVWAMYIFK